MLTNGLPKKPMNKPPNPFRQLVTEAGLTHRQVAELSGLSINTVDRLLAKPEHVSEYTRAQFAATFGKRVRVRYEISEE